MTLEREAIDKIEDLALKAHHRNAEALDGKVALLAGKTIDLEDFQATRRNYRVKFDTRDMADFVRYVDGAGDAAVYVDPDKMAARAIFDLGDKDAPGHARHRASLALRKTPELEAILETDSKYLTQQDAVLFLQDWAHCFVGAFHGEGESMSLAGALAAIRQIKIEASGARESAVGNHANSRSSLENVGVANVLPEDITLRAAPFVGLPEMNFDLIVIVNLEGAKPTIRFRLMQRGSLDDRIARSFVDELRGLFGHRDVLIGTLAA